MWQIRITKLFREVDGKILPGKTTFTTPGGHEKDVEVRVCGGPVEGYVFAMPGQRGDLTTRHGPDVVLEFEVLKIDEDVDAGPANFNPPGVTFEGSSIRNQEQTGVRMIITFEQGAEPFVGTVVRQHKLKNGSFEVGEDGRLVLYVRDEPIERGLT